MKKELKYNDKRTQTRIAMGFYPFVFIIPQGHLYASLLIGSGVDPTTVSGILGHSQVTTSLNIYSHMFKENQMKAFDAVAETFSITKKDTA